MLIETSFPCGVCGEENWTTVDASGGDAQVYVEDCRVCCRPNTLRVYADPALGTARVDASFEE